MPRRQKVVTEWQRLSELIGYYVLTGYIAESEAQSVLLVGAPGSGKSSLVRRFVDAPRCRVVLDITVDGLRRNLLPDIKSKGYKTVLMPEFYKPFQRQASTVQNMVGLLTAGMSGEIDSMLVGPEGYEYNGVQFGIVGAMTSQVFGDWSRSLTATGVLDRMSVLPVSFSSDERDRIEKNIFKQNVRDLTPMGWRWPSETCHIRWDRRLLGPLRRLVNQILTEDRNRLIHQLISLTRAIALHDGKRTTMLKHVRVLQSYMDFLRHIRPERG